MEFNPVVSSIMLDLSEYSTLAFFVIGILSFLLMISIKVILDMVRKQQQHNIENNRIFMDHFRKNIEEIIYEKTEKMSSNVQQWLDINHLLISKENKSLLTNKKSNNVSSDFLRMHGIEDADLDFEHNLI